MRILIAGAGAVGGAFGARLLQAGRDVTFLVRPTRAEALARDGLRFRAPDGQWTHRVPAVTSVPASSDPYDLVIVAVKAPAVTTIAGQLAHAVGPGTLVLPLLNGMGHVDTLERAFPGRVLGGLARIVATLDDTGTVVQLTPLSDITVGAFDAAVPDAVSGALSVPGIDVRADDRIADRMWEKWAFIAAAGVVTCLFRGSVGDILTAGGETQILAAIAETEAVAAAAGHPVGETGHAELTGFLTEPGSSFTSSLYRDLLRGDAVEAEHILGDLAARARRFGVSTPLLDAAVTQTRTHQVTRGSITAGR